MTSGSGYSELTATRRQRNVVGDHIAALMDDPRLEETDKGNTSEPVRRSRPTPPARWCFDTRARHLRREVIATVAPRHDSEIGIPLHRGTDHPGAKVRQSTRTCPRLCAQSRGGAEVQSVVHSDRRVVLLSQRTGTVMTPVCPVRPAGGRAGDGCARRRYRPWRPGSRYRRTIRGPSDAGGPRQR